MNGTVHISGLYRYPLKSARAQELPAAVLRPTGLDGDREWLLTTPQGRFITQRETPRLALLQTDTDASTLRLSAPGLAELRVARTCGTPRQVQIWGDTCGAFDAGDLPAQALSAWLGRECRLVRFDYQQRRACDPAWTGNLVATSAFADAFPLLLINRASLADLNRRIGRELPVNRFRPNLVVDGLEPYDEDRLSELRVDGIVLRVVKPCTRCRITTTDQASGELDGDEPLRTLRSYRYDAALQGVSFGQNLIIAAGVGQTLRRGLRLSLRWRG
jgi:uncharacterized protein YcbX